jgi:hypothetical protein
MAVCLSCAAGFMAISGKAAVSVRDSTSKMALCHRGEDHLLARTASAAKA